MGEFRWIIAAGLFVVLVGCPSKGTATLTLFPVNCRINDVDGTTPVIAEAITASGQPGAGSVSFTAKAGTFLNNTSTVTLDATGHGTATFTCPVAQDPKCAGMISMSGSWNGLQAPAAVNVTPPGDGGTACVLEGGRGGGNGGNGDGGTGADGGGGGLDLLPYCQADGGNWFYMVGHPNYAGGGVVSFPMVPSVTYTAVVTNSLPDGGPNFSIADIFFTVIGAPPSASFWVGDTLAPLSPQVTYSTSTPQQDGGPMLTLGSDCAFSVGSFTIEHIEWGFGLNDAGPPRPTTMSAAFEEICTSADIRGCISFVGAP